MNEPDPRGDRRERLRRAEALLDRWLDLFEEAIEDARPDPSKTAELANVFTICRRILEIEKLARQLDAQEEHAHESPRGLVDSNLFGDGIPPLDPEE